LIPAARKRGDIDTVFSRVAGRSCALALIVVTASGCAARAGSFAHRFVKPGEPTASYDGPVQGRAPDLAEYSRKIRELQMKARPKTGLLPTIEQLNPDLAEALLRVALIETAENHRLAAAAYRRAGVNDYAFRHYQRALRLEPCDSVAYEGLARTWRDWGMPDLGLGDAHRAIYCRPHSASAYNTLGTLLVALGQRKPARDAFQFALTLQPAAAFAWNNLCFLSMREGDGQAAQRACERALALEPAMPAARTNLALAYAIQGNIARAEAQLLDGPDPAEAQYNLGILRMSVGDYAQAAKAFDSAAARRPSMWDAHRRASQARQLAAAQKVH
jgi:Flp pilus assembly protein TadD